jgi:hypothetical protein
MLLAVGLNVHIRLCPPHFAHIQQYIDQFYDFLNFTGDI